MRKFLQTLSVAKVIRVVETAAVTGCWFFLLGSLRLDAADVSYWIEPCSNPETSCVATDVQLARWAFEAWQAASQGKIRFVPAADRERALIRLFWATPEQGMYGETQPFIKDGRRGAQIYVRI